MLSRAIATESRRRAEVEAVQYRMAAAFVDECMKTCYIENQDNKPRFLVFHVRLATIREKFEPTLAINLWPASWKDAADWINEAAERELKKDPAVATLKAEIPKRYQRELLGTTDDVVEFRYTFRLLPVADVAEKGKEEEEVVTARVVW